MPERTKLGLVYNRGAVEELVGPYKVPGKTYGRIPAHHIAWLKTTNQATVLQPVEGNPQLEVFIRTLIQPTNPRYKGV